MAPLMTLARRQFLICLVAALGMIAMTNQAAAETIDRSLMGEPSHKLVYQLNKADEDYIDSILFSVGEMLRKYNDDIRIVVTVIGPGLHLIGKKPERPISDIARQRAESLAMYGVEFHACGNTMKSLGWSEKDIEDYASIVDIGAEDLMLLQEQGYAYISW